MPCRRRWDCCQPRPRCFSSSDTGQDNGGAAANVDFQRQQSQRGLPTALCDCQPATCLAYCNIAITSQ
ncbi:unnamed protein product [Linum trigynum]|uniref:Uncharacterized protein n=1 Tax=Linum trigynum TaxID=586398 RepID=A0AAV2CUB5_9ROSI